MRAACDRSLERLGEQLLAVISMEREALQQPVEESERRIAAMKQTIGQVERSMRELGLLFMAEQRHLSDTFVGRHKAFLRSLLPQANDEFQAALRLVPRGMGPRYRRLTMREAQKVARRHVMPWLQSEQEEAERQYRAVTVRSDILNRVQKSCGRLEVEIRKLLHEIRHIADQALSHAKTAQAAGRPQSKRPLQS